MFIRRRVRFVVQIVFAVLLVLVPALRVQASDATSLPSCNPLMPFNSNNFTHPTQFSNPWYPLVPGTQFIMDGHSNLGGGVLPHRIVFTVTDLTKVIHGVRSLVLWDTDTNGGELVESELAFQAQDNAGNAWVLGEYPEEYEGGVFTGAPFTWISGIGSAQAGVLVPGNPQVGTPAFREGYSPSIDFFDCGQVLATDETLLGPNNTYTDVLAVNEWSPLDPGSGTQQKYYAPGMGNVQIGAVDDPEGETLVLTKIVHLSPSALAAVREEALKLDRHGYQVSDVYSQTPPAEHTLQAGPAPADTTTTLTSSPNPSFSGQPALFTARVTVDPPGTGTPTGVVTFTIDGNAIARPLDMSGMATYSTTSLAVGTHAVWATYGGDANLGASWEGLAGGHVVTETAITSLSLSSSSSSPIGPTLGQTTWFTATAPGENLVYAWNMGDGSPVMDGRGPAISYVYKRAGSYTIVVTGTNDVSEAVGTMRIVVNSWRVFMPTVIRN